jgi:hypothetical protein
MLNQNKLQKLFEIATGQQPETQRLTAAKKKTNTLDRVKKRKDIFKSIYNDPFDAFEKWYQDSLKDVSSDNADEFWSEAEQEFPGSPDQAKDWLRSQVKKPTDPAARESSLRNTMTKAPSWLNQELSPELANTEQEVTSQNLSKSQLAYRKVLENKIQAFKFDQLDPDVPAEIHVDDMIKLELMGLLDGASIIEGRFATTNRDGSIQPAFALSNSTEANGVGLGPETELITKMAKPLFERAVVDGLDTGIATQEMNNRAVTGAGLQMLPNMDVSEWSTILGAMPKQDIPAAVQQGFNRRAEIDPFASGEEMLADSLSIEDLLR